MLTIDSLIGIGYLPRELIPPITSAELASNLGQILPTLSSFARRHSRCELYSTPRTQHHRRLLRIPNPLHQIRLSKVLADNWSDLEAFITHPASLSASTPTVDPGSDRALKLAKNFGEVAIERSRRSTGARYVLEADFSMFYRTIYTHSIPWALHGKAKAKRLMRSPKLLGNEIDEAVRSTMGNQTVGIPVGPDTSFLIAEIIGVAVDKELRANVSGIKGLRYVDDYHLYFVTASQAEVALSMLHKAGYEFELELNPNKTAIKALPEPIDPPWVSALKLHDFRQNQTAQRSDLVSYFSRAFEYEKAFTDNLVLKYAIARVAALTVHEENWRLYHAFLLQSITADPKVIPTVLSILLAYRQLGYPRLVRSTSGIIHEMIAYHSRFNNIYELAWILWLSRALGIRIRRRAAQLLSQIDSSAVALVALDLRDSGLMASGLDTSGWESLLVGDELYSEHWLLSYEAYNKGWLNGPKGDHVSPDDFFGTLMQHDVSFYEIAAEATVIDLMAPDEVSASTRFGYGVSAGY